MQNTQRKKGAFCATRTDGDAQGVQYIILAELHNFSHRLTFDHLGKHRCCRLADSASAPLETHCRYVVTIYLEINRQLVSTQRIGVFGVRVGMLQLPVVARVAIMIQDVFTIIIN